MLQDNWRQRLECESYFLSKQLNQDKPQGYSSLLPKLAELPELLRLPTTLCVAQTELVGFGPRIVVTRPVIVLESRWRTLKV